MSSKKDNRQCDRIKTQKSHCQREIRKRHYKSLEEFISHIASAVYKMKPNTFKLLKHMNKDITELANINPGPSKEIF